jgi:hypothetical protein
MVKVSVKYFRVKVTLPMGVTWPAGFTVAVKVTFWPWMEGF